MKARGLSDIFWTIILMIVVVVMIVMAFLVSLTIRTPFFFTADPISYSVEFINIVNKPFMTAEALAHVKFGDRGLIEQSIETSVTSLENAKATGLPREVSYFLDKYSMKEYLVSIKQGANELVRIESKATKCGDEDQPEGWCVSKVSSAGLLDCGVGRIEINPTKLTCGAFQRCCKEDRAAYGQLPDHKDIQPCGAKQQGVCSEGVRPLWAWSYEILKGTYYKYSCEENRLDLGNPPECRATNVNNGNTRACCAPQTAEIEIKPGLTNKIVVPLLYKQSAAALEVTVR